MHWDLSKKWRLKAAASERRLDAAARNEMDRITVLHELRDAGRRFPITDGHGGFAGAFNEIVDARDPLVVDRDLK